MYLIDTSVLIDALKGVNNNATEQFKFIESQNTPYGICSLSYMEVLQGIKSGKRLEQTEAILDAMRVYHLPTQTAAYNEAAALYRRCREHGVTIRSTIDILIAKVAIDNDLLLLHNDSDFANMSKALPELKIAASSLGYECPIGSNR
jgi:predicted nucleic acid-binding protein